jgi:hypothetical protein
MDCPACREPMVVLELRDVEIDHCLSCGAEEVPHLSETYGKGAVRDGVQGAH